MDKPNLLSLFDVENSINMIQLPYSKLYTIYVVHPNRTISFICDFDDHEEAEHACAALKECIFKIIRYLEDPSNEVSDN